jgi:large subunit ribosomal protein L3
MNTKPGIIGKKLGMTQLYKDDGTVMRVTVLDMSAVAVVGKRTKEKDGYTALVFGVTDAKDKHLTKAQQGSFKKVGAPAKRQLQELRCTEEYAATFEIGAPIKLDEIFKAEQKVDTRGITNGRGFTGVMRRWNFAGAGSDTHGTHEYRRHGGSIGTNMTPGRTLPNLKMPGQYGNETVSILNLKVARVDSEKGLLMIEGGIPGSKNGLVLVRHAVKERLRKAGRS